MAVTHGQAAVAQQDAQVVARMGAQEATAGVTDGAMVVQPGFQVRRVQAQAAAGLVEQGEGMAAQQLRGAGGLHGLMLAQDEGRRFRPNGRLAALGARIVDGKTPRRVEVEGGQFVAVVVIAFRGVAHRRASQALSRTMSTWGMPASRNSSLATRKPSRS
ncbi:hypothetical protein D3C84_491800 [compost metagenome]